MTILTVDENQEVLDKTSGIIEKLFPDASLFSFTSSLSALAEARNREIDCAFLNVNMPELGGLDLGRYLKDLNPFVNLVFMGDHTESSYEALTLHASGFLPDPAGEADIRKEMDDLRYPEEWKKHKRVFAQTFGNFEFFVDGKPVAFKYTRTKEMVAVLVNNRGAQTTNGEIIACLWEDDGDPEKKTSYLSNLRQDLQNTLSRLKVSNIIIKQRGSMAIDTEKIECDLYDWLDKKKDSQYHYLGDYMNQYSWPEFRHAELDEISYAMDDE